MRVVSLVPSWTETLIEAGVSVVGRTRFCIHPADHVRNIPAVGGTKDLDLEKITALAPDLIVLDREENTREMAEALVNISPIHVTHVQSVQDMPAELRSLAQTISRGQLADKAVLALENFAVRFGSVTSVARPLKPGPVFAYVIWKDPWICVSRETFIASMLQQVGYDLTNLWAGGSASKYPKFDLVSLPKGTHLLLSSEPFPFAKKLADVEALLKSAPLASKNLTYEIVDGESYSWFGIRALRFLEGVPKYG